MNKSDEIQTPSQNKFIPKGELELKLSGLIFQLIKEVQRHFLIKKEIPLLMKLNGDIGKFTIFGLKEHNLTQIQAFLQGKGVTSLIGNVKSYMGLPVQGLKLTLNCTQLEEVLGKIAQAAEQTPAPRMWCSTGAR